MSGERLRYVRLVCQCAKPKPQTVTSTLITHDPLFGTTEEPQPDYVYCGKCGYDMPPVGTP